jgi:hypothetical protein
VRAALRRDPDHDREAKLMHEVRRDWRAGTVLVSVLAALSIAVNVFVGFHTTGFARSMVRRLVEGPAGFAGPAAQVDTVLADAPARGSLLLQFAEFGRADEAAVELFYYRSVYRLYPRRVLAAQPGTVINRGRDILGAPVDPDDAWLGQQDISCVIACERDAAGGISCDVHRSP